MSNAQCFLGHLKARANGCKMLSKKNVACCMPLLHVRRLSAMCSVARLFLRVAYVESLFKEQGIQLFRERLAEKMCTRQTRKVIRDIINTLFLTL